MEGLSKSNNQRERPPEIREAMKTGNIDYLRAAGRKGGLRSALAREVERLIQQEKRKKLLKEMQDTLNQRNGDPDD